MVEIARLRPTTCGTEPVHKYFVAETLGETCIAQTFRNHGSFSKFLRSGFRLLLRPQQLGFQHQL
jgi:hypothetical protein